MAGRSGGYFIELWLWAVLLWFAWHLYPMVNAAAWRMGGGEYLVQRPWATAHHRVLWSYDWLVEAAGEQRAYYERHLRQYTDVPPGQRAARRAELDRIERTTRRAIGVWIAVVLGSYAVLVVTPMELVSWLDRRDRRVSPTLP